MIDNILSIIAPHHCCGCGLKGTLLCDSCKYNIIDDRKFVCIVCHRPTAREWLCDDCAKKVTFEHAWVVSERAGALKRLINAYKFENAKNAYKFLGDLLIEVLPTLPKNTVIVPIPTTSKRQRQRGYDHMLLVAKYMAKKLGVEYESPLVHKTSTQQRGASADVRQKQAKKAFCVNQELDPTKNYLLIDDVITTGATIKYASKTLKAAGAKHVWVAVVARQVLKCEVIICKRQY